DVSLNEGNWKPISLSVRLAGDPSHDLRVSYIVEMPLWKPAYRIVVGDEGEPLLQGWAVVDNVSGEEWNNVDLRLVAGTPMSFIYDLHSPQFMDRVDLPPRRGRTAMAPAIEPAGVASGGGAPSSKDSLQRSYAKKRSAGESVAPAPAAPRSAPGADYAEAEESSEDARMERDDDFDMIGELEEQVSSSAAG